MSAEPTQGEESVSASITIGAPVETVFAVLAAPGNHAAIDGTGWVRASVDGEALTRSGQVFRMTMYHPNHPDGQYEIANQVRAFDPPYVISWAPGQDLHGDGTLEFGGWIWRYDLAGRGPRETEVRLTYDWSAVPQDTRDHIGFPPFPPDHLENSLRHLAEIVASAGPGGPAPA